MMPARRRALLPTATILLCAAACSPADNNSPEAGPPTVKEAGIDSRDVVVPDPEEGGSDARDVSPPDTVTPGETGTDVDADSDVQGDGESDANDGDAGPAPDGDGGQPDSDVATPDSDVATPDSDAPPLSCERTQERLSFNVTFTATSDIHECTHGGPTDGGPRTLHGVLSGVVRLPSTDAGTGSAVTIDMCTSDGCGAQLATIKVETPTPFTVPVGALVEAEYWIERSFQCSYHLRISNLPEWNGRTNPISDVAKTYVVASDGFSNPTSKMAATGIAVSPKRLGCPSPDGLCGGILPVDNYVFEFSASAGAPLTVPMGQSLPMLVNGQNLVARNHRSYESGFCDDYWNWSFTILGQ
jgi:hypothetical protein